MSAKEVRAAMASLEDADDVEAGRALEREAADEQMEFDDTAASTKVRPVRQYVHQKPPSIGCNVCARSSDSYCFDGFKHSL